MAQEVALLWIEKGLEPLSSRKPDRIYKHTLKEAVDAALNSDVRVQKEEEGYLPWIRAGTGEGAAMLNVQGIILLQLAFEEGMSIRP